jgi:hypothetical protein
MVQPGRATDGSASLLSSSGAADIPCRNQRLAAHAAMTRRARLAAFVVIVSTTGEQAALD